MSNQNRPINALPKTPAELRATLDRLEKNSSTTGGGVIQSIFDSVFDEATADVAVSIGDIVYMSGAGTVDLAQADAPATHLAVGVVTVAAILGGTCEFQTQGIVGGFSGLVPNSVYYLSAVTVGGMVSPTDSLTAGQYVVFLGKAISTTELLFLPSTIVLL